jgi:hypothetical protein
MNQTIGDNIFNITDAEDCICKLVGVANPHWTLAISVINPSTPKDELFLRFPHAAFFSGRTAWKGANFRIATPDEFQKFAAEVSEEFLKKAEDYFLFIVQTSDNIQIQILASSGSRSDTDDLVPYNEI